MSGKTHEPSVAIPRPLLEELQALYREDGLIVTDAEALEAAQWLLARAKAVPFDIPAEMQASWDAIVAQALHPHYGHSQPNGNMLEQKDNDVSDVYP